VRAAIEDALDVEGYDDGSYGPLLVRRGGGGGAGAGGGGRADAGGWSAVGEEEGVGQTGGCV